MSVSGSLASTLGQANPFRYRGYYYDAETGFYYLNSRYYDPETGRFVNADGVLGANQDLLSYNLFAYCSNNPVNYSDPSGYGLFDDLCDGISTVIDWLFPGSKARAQKIVSGNATVYDTANWLTMGAVETVKGAVAPEKPLSLEHWVDSAATAAMIVGAGSGIKAVGNSIKTSISTRTKPFVPTEYWTRNAPTFGTPNAKFDHYKLNLSNNTIERSTIINDFAGRQQYRIDWTNHGRMNHTKPHLHERIYNAENYSGFKVRWDLY